MKKLQAVIKQNKAIVIVFCLSLIVVLSFPFLSDKTIYIPIDPSPRVQSAQSATFSYTGRTGKDALTLLKEQTSIEQDNSGLVVAINNRKAESSKKEYWSFYVNGKMASVGPADYQTKDTDKIEWKIETF